VDAAVAAVAKRQYGLVTRAQLRRGVGETGIRERLRTSG
jgi:hypothetical protein